MGSIWQKQVFRVAQFPYRHAAMENIFSDDVFEQVKKIAFKGNNWVKDVGPLHSFWSLTDVGNAFREDACFAAQLEEAQILLEQALRLRLAAADISIFKLCAGDAIGIHDDSDIKAVRLVVKLSGPASKNLDGELILFGESVSESVVYDMPQNCGVGFVTSSEHIHSISQSLISQVIYMVAEYPIKAHL